MKTGIDHLWSSSFVRANTASNLQISVSVPNTSVARIGERENITKLTRKQHTALVDLVCNRMLDLFGECRILRTKSIVRNSKGNALTQNIGIVQSYCIGDINTNQITALEALARDLQSALGVHDILVEISTGTLAVFAGWKRGEK